ncbi:hypothetical protein IJG20_00400 [Candidatus Saccharibacteria bacterium]|nr:hypothetical protein [Candidatus Saccharibacteria bacterium]
MEFIKQALLSAKILTPGGYINDALVSNNACVCDSHGTVTHIIEYDAYKTDLLVRNKKTGRYDLRIKLPYVM